MIFQCYKTSPQTRQEPIYHASEFLKRIINVKICFGGIYCSCLHARLSASTSIGELDLHTVSCDWQATQSQAQLIRLRNIDPCRQWMWQAHWSICYASLWETLHSGIL